MINDLVRLLPLINSKENTSLELLSIEQLFAKTYQAGRCTLMFKKIAINKIAVHKNLAFICDRFLRTMEVFSERLNSIRCYIFHEESAMFVYM